MTNFGWSLMDTQAQARDRLLARGTFKTPASQFFLDRYISHEQSLTALFEQFPYIEGVGLEAPIYNESYSEGAYGLHLFTLRALREARQDVVLFLPPQLKGLARGHFSFQRKGPVPKMTKQDMISAVKRLLARPNEIHVKLNINEHEADASIAAWYGGRFFELLNKSVQRSDLSEAEQHVFAEEHKIKQGARKGQVDQKGLVFREGDRFFLFSSSESSRG